jgi:mannitol-specific phosphotransferase system IIBC component
VLAYLDPSMIQNPDKPLMNPAGLRVTALISAVLTGLILWQMKRSSEDKKSKFKSQKSKKCRSDISQFNLNAKTAKETQRRAKDKSQNHKITK